MNCPIKKTCPKQPGSTPLSMWVGKDVIFCTRCDKPGKDKKVKEKAKCHV